MPSRTDHARVRRGLFSPLIRRVLAVNLFALAILAGGIFYLTGFRESLTERRMDQLLQQTRILAGAIGEAATESPDATRIDRPQAAAIIARLVGPTDVRARLFGLDGRLLVDSRFLAGSGGILEEPLPPLDDSPSLSERIMRGIDRVLDAINPQPALPPYREGPRQRASDYFEVISALTGAHATQIRSLGNGRTRLLSAAAPVQRFRQVQGALLLTVDTGDIERIVRDEQITILRMFGLALAATLLLSVFLGSTIVRPIRMLAAAADRVRHGLGREATLPQFRRRDEIGDLSHALSEMTAALYRQIDAVEAFAADVAHELKNPLSSLRSAVESLERVKDPEMRAKLSAIIEQDVQRIDRLITDISEASRLDAELLRGEIETVDLGALAETLVEAQRNRLGDTPEAPELALVRPGAAPVRVAGLESRLAQVIANLLDNATSFSPPGGRVELTVQRRESSAELTVSDEGPGLPAESEEKIFSRFYSERPEKEAFGTHSGLGLSISRQIVEAHKGTIHAANRTDPDSGAVIGARFIVRLPAR